MGGLFCWTTIGQMFSIGNQFINSSILSHVRTFISITTHRERDRCLIKVSEGGAWNRGGKHVLKVLLVVCGV